MAINLLDGSIPKALTKALGTLFYDAVLIHDVYPAPNEETPWVKEAPVPQRYACKAAITSYSDYSLANSLVQVGDRKILILATTLLIEPAVTDRIEIRGDTYTVVAPVKTDPVKAMWVAQGRK